MLALRDIQRYDKSDMYKDYVAWPIHAEEALKIPLEIPDATDFDSVVYAGMGGSGTAGDVISDWLQPTWEKPFVVTKDFTLPAFVGSKTLVLLVSYSGNTREVLSCFADGSKKGGKIVTISSGGALERFAKERGIPHLKLGKTVTPRSGFAWLLYASLSALSRLLPSDMSRQIEVSISTLRKLSKELAAERNERSNPSKKLAKWLSRGLPLILAQNSFRGVALRFKNSLNENAKLVALPMIIPESCHNDLEAISQKQALLIRPVLITGNGPSEKMALATSIFSRMLKRRRIRVFEVGANGTMHLERLVSVLYKLEFATLYAAILRKVDPGATFALDEFRAEIQKRLPA